MLKRYRFDLESSDDVIRDEAGVVAEGVDQAIREAATVIKEMRVSGELSETDEHWALIIRDEDGTELKRIPL